MPISPNPDVHSGAKDSVCSAMGKPGVLPLFLSTGLVTSEAQGESLLVGTWRVGILTTWQPSLFGRGGGGRVLTSRGYPADGRRS